MPSSIDPFVLISFHARAHLRAGLAATTAIHDIINSEFLQRFLPLPLNNLYMTCRARTNRTTERQRHGVESVRVRKDVDGNFLSRLLVPGRADVECPQDTRHIELDGPRAKMHTGTGPATPTKGTMARRTWVGGQAGLVEEALRLEGMRVGEVGFVEMDWET